MRHLRWTLTAAAVLVLLTYAARRVDWCATALILSRSAGAPLIAAMVINAISMALHGVRWWIFLRPVGAASLPLAIRGAVVGAGFNNLLLANGGDAARLILMARAAGISRATVLATLAVDRLFDPLCYSLLLLLATFVVPLPPSLSGMRTAVSIALVVGTVLATLIVMTTKRDDDASGAQGWRGHLRAFRRQIAQLLTRGRFAGAFATSVAIWGLDIATFALVASASHVAIPVVGSVAALLLTNTGLLLRATPGNVGYFQFAYAVAVQPFGVASDAAVAAALLLQIVQIVPITLAALAFAPQLLERQPMEASGAT